MRGTVSERIYREAKVMRIGGGAEEIMKELAAATGLVAPTPPAQRHTTVVPTGEQVLPSMLW